jgi:hypothetical protein
MSLKDLENVQIFGSPLIVYDSLGSLLLGFFINIIVAIIIVRFIFYPLYKQKNYLFSYFLINVSVFLVCALLSSLKLKIGFAFGLFAVFSIIRYRTEAIPIKEMTYLFIVIIVGVINALAVEKISLAEIIASNLIVIFSLYLVEKSWLKQRDVIKEIRYEKIELIRPDKREELYKDLKERTGFDVHKIDIERINFMNDTVDMKIYYKEPKIQN